MTDLEELLRGFHVRVCPLYRKERNRAFLVGTGVPFTDAETCYIITDAHVLDELPGQTVITAGRDSLIRFAAGTSSVQFIPGASIDADVAVIRLPAEAKDQMASRFQFSTVEDCAGVAEYDKFVVYAVLGYPHSRNKPRPSSMAELRATPTFVVLREFADLAPFAASGKDPRIHFALSAPFKTATGFDQQSYKLPNLQGMSGGGIWRIDLDRHIGTVKQTGLVGIAIEHHQRAAIIATRMAVPLELIRREQGSVPI